MVELKNEEIEVLKFLKEVKQETRNIKLNDRFFCHDEAYLEYFEHLEKLGFIYFIDGNNDLSNLFDDNPTYLPDTFWGRILPKGEKALKNWLKFNMSK